MSEEDGDENEAERPELALRSAFHRAGMRFRVHRKPVATSRREADLVFPTEKVAVFIDGCFWHGCPEHGTWPRENAEWWRSKIEANIARDRDTDALLAAHDWLAIRIWEHEDTLAASERVARAVEARR